MNVAFVAPRTKVPPDVELVVLEYHWYVGIIVVEPNVTVKGVGVPFKHTVLEAGCVVILGAGFTVTI